MDIITTLVVILLILWLLGFSLGAVGSLIHILLVIAVILILLRIIEGRSVLSRLNYLMKSRQFYPLISVIFAN